jgi:hypothetical protein
MTRPLTPEAEALLECMDEQTDLDWFRARLAAIEDAAAARERERWTVDRLVGVLHRGGWGVPPGGCRQYLLTTARDGVTTVREDTTPYTCEHASLHVTFAEGLIAAIEAEP